MICFFKGEAVHEGGGEPAVHRKGDCPKGTICKNDLADEDDDLPVSTPCVAKNPPYCITLHTS